MTPSPLRRRVFDLITTALVLACLLLLARPVETAVFRAVSALTGKKIQVTWAGYLHGAALAGAIGLALVWLTLRVILPNRARIREAWLGLRGGLAEPERAGAAYRVTWVDGLILVAFALFSALLFLDALQGPYPYVRLGSDAGNIASFAAAQRSPGLFQGDEILADPANLRSYSTLNILILNLIEPLAGNYSLAFAWFIPFQTLITLVGFYLLGLALFERLAPPRRRLWAFLLAVALAAPFEINLLETWGITGSPVTRFTFQALLPYLLVLALRWRSKPARWPVILLLAGLMSFVHPVSTPAWVFALWLGLLACLPSRWSLVKKALVMLGLAAVAGVALAPYAANYLGSSAGPRQPIPYDLFMQVVIHQFPRDITNIPAAVMDFAGITWSAGLLPVGLLGLDVLLALPWRDRQRLNMALLWLAGLLFVSLAVPWAEHAVEAAYRIAPLETELPRGLRYGVFFMILFAAWALAELDARLQANRAWLAPVRQVAIGAGLLLVAVWLAGVNPALVLSRRPFDCLAQGRLICAQYTDDDRVIQAVRELTPPGAEVFTTFANDTNMSFSLPVRYQAFRPLVYTYKDRGQLITAHSPAVVGWYERFQEMETVRTAGFSPEERMQQYLTLARAWNAGYVISDIKPNPAALPAMGATLVYENGTYLLLKVERKP